MPKMKSHSGAKKRFFKTAKGKWRHQRAGKRHLLAPLSSNRSMFLSGKNTLTKTEGKTIGQYLPYA
jgi:large subunit ribosomal protein L35